MNAATQAKPPSLFWTLTEGRAIFELGSFGILRKAMKTLPRGDGHSVLVLPGFMATDGSTRPMRSLLDDLGYESIGWGLGRNVRFNRQREEEMHELIERIYKARGRRMSIIGWSLGGVFAREMAKQHPDKIRMVISLGSPISNDRNHSSARHLFNAINGTEIDAAMESRYAKLHEAPPVPTTSIFTKTDGIVAWRGSVQEDAPQTENICLPASHIGLGVNPLVMVAIADRLAQKEGSWKPFDRSGWRSLFFEGVPAS
ncbi:MAG: alpha/beta hydrolase [Rhizobiales bacterium]|nr:alpha/beta hydrolase [Hyphomicrobiales bacterium]